MNGYKTLSITLSALALTLLVLTFSGCTFRTVKAGPTLLAEYKPEMASTIVVGDFQSKKLSEEQRQVLRREIAKSLKEEAAFAQVLNNVPLEGKKERTVLLDGEIVEYEEGSRFLQWFIGLGAGASEITASFNLSTLEGQRIVAFTVEEDYAGGAGIGGVSYLSMEDLLEKIGADVAVTVSRWKRGEPVGETESREDEGTAPGY